MYWRGVAHFRWKRRYVGQRGEKVVGFVEQVDGGVAFAPRGGEEDAGLAVGAEGDVGGEAGSTAGFLHDCGWGGRVAELNPSHAYASWIAGVAEALNRLELGWTERDGKSRGELRGRTGDMQQVLEQLGHIGGSGIDAAAGS